MDGGGMAGGCGGDGDTILVTVRKSDTLSVVMPSSP